MLREAAALVRREKLNQRPVMVLAKEGWHPGVLGIVAARLAEEHHRPVAMVSLQNGTGRGSARSVEGFHLFKGLQACEAVLRRYGGHAAAAGFEVAADQVGALQAKLEQAFGEQVGPEPPRPTLKVDAQVQLAELNREFFGHLERLRPFGPGNPAPVFVCREVECLSSRVVAERHLKVQLHHAELRHGGHRLRPGGPSPPGRGPGCGLQRPAVALPGALDSGIAAAGLGHTIKAGVSGQWSVASKRKSRKAERQWSVIGDQ